MEDSLRLFNEFTPRVLGGGDIEARIPIDLIEKPDRFVLCCELPGVSKENIDVKMEGANTVIISAEKPELYELEKADWKRRGERSCGRVQRVVQLPAGADIENATATNKDGILCLSIPKREQKPVKLAIR